MDILYDQPKNDLLGASQEVKLTSPSCAYREEKASERGMMCLEYAYGVG